MTIDFSMSFSSPLLVFLGAKVAIFLDMCKHIA